MNKIDLRRFDLNLLVVFEQLMAQRSVGRAALRLGLSQPATSTRNHRSVIRRPLTRR